MKSAQSRQLTALLSAYVRHGGKVTVLPSGRARGAYRGDIIR